MAKKIKVKQIDGAQNTITPGPGIAVLNNGVVTEVSISQPYLDKIQLGEWAYTWGNHANAGYLKLADLNGYATENWVSSNFSQLGHTHPIGEINGLQLNLDRKVNQGGTPNHQGNAIWLGWSGSQLELQVDLTYLGYLWHSGNFNPDTKANYDGSNLTNIPNWQSVLGLNNSNFHIVRQNLLTSDTNNVDGNSSGSMYYNQLANSPWSSSQDTIGSISNFGGKTFGFDLASFPLYNDTSPQVFTRTYSSGVVGIWKRLLTEADMPTFALNLQQVTNNGASTTIPSTFNNLTIGYTSGGYKGFDSNLDYAFLLNGSSANRILTGGVLTSDAYADGQYIPTNGIYSKGTIATSSHGTSADWNAKVSNYDVAIAIGFLSSDADRPYFQHSTSGAIELANKNWVNNNFASNTLVSNKVDNIAYVGGLAFSSGIDDIPYMLNTNTGNPVGLATNNWVINNFASNTSVNNKVDRAGDNMSGSLHINTTDDTGTTTDNLTYKLYLSNFGGAYGMKLGAFSNGQGFIQQGRNDSNVPYDLLLNPLGGNVIVPNATANNHAVNLGQLNAVASAIPTVNNGSFVVQGVGALTGAGSTSANASANTTATLDLTTATKNEIAQGVDAYNTIQNSNFAPNNGYDYIPTGGSQTIQPTATKTTIAIQGIGVTITLQDGVNDGDECSITTCGGQQYYVDGSIVDRCSNTTHEAQTSTLWWWHQKDNVWYQAI